MLPYLEITHTESHCHVGLCLIKPNTLWKLFGLDIPNVISAQVDGRKVTLGTSSRCERVKVSLDNDFVDTEVGHLLGRDNQKGPRIVRSVVEVKHTWLDNTQTYSYMPGL